MPIEFTLSAKGRVGKRRKAAAIKAIRSRDPKALAAFQSRPAPLRLNVVGSFYDNADGSSRQAETRKLRAGEPVELRREPDNRHDPSAVAVFSARGVQIGYIGEQRTAWIGSKIDKGMAVRAQVDRLVGARRGPEPVKAIIRIDIEAAA